MPPPQPDLAGQSKRAVGYGAWAACLLPIPFASSSSSTQRGTDTPEQGRAGNAFSLGGSIGHKVERMCTLRKEGSGPPVRSGCVNGGVGKHWGMAKGK